MTNTDASSIAGQLVHSSVLVFLPGVCPQARSDILLANAFAQQVAWGDLKDGLEPDWFRNYWRNLAALGFDGKLAPAGRRPGPDRGSLAAQAIEHISQAGSARLGEAANQALEALRRDYKALKLFSAHSIVGTQARVQLLPCAQQSNGFIDMVLLHMDVSMEKSTSDFLFMGASNGISVRDLRLEVIHFNLQGFREDYRRRAEASVARTAERVIRDLVL